MSTFTYALFAICIAVGINVARTAFADPPGGPPAAATVLDAGIDDPNGIATSPGAVASGSGSGSAMAATTPAVPAVTDPTDIATDWSMVKTYGWVWGSMILIAGLLMWLGSKNSEFHWVNSSGRLYFAATGLGGILAALVTSHFAHTDYAGVVVTAVGALKLILSPPKPSTAVA
jgi:hypothetical protein